MKKLFALFMAVVMITGMLAVTASAESEPIKIGLTGPLTGNAS